MKHCYETDGTARLEQDPVCGMLVDVKPATGHSTHAGKDYYFCCRSCLDKFEADPQKYLESKPAPAPAQQAPAGVEYTCPMHPQIIRDKPGSCPICGMALEPLTATDDDTANPELVSMTRRLWIALC